MKVRLHNPRRDLEVRGGRRVLEVLTEMGMNPESYLVIRGGALLTADAVVGDDDEIEIRPVISGGAAGGAPCAA